MSKGAWITLGIVLLILGFIAFMYFRNRKLLNKKAATDTTKKTAQIKSTDSQSTVNTAAKANITNG